MAIIPRQAKRPTGLWVKMTAVTILGLCFIFVWTVFSSSSSSVSFQRESFEDISEPVSSSSSSNVQKQTPKSEKRVEVEKDHKLHKSDEKKVDGSSSNSSSTRPHKKEVEREKKRVHKKEDNNNKENVNQGSLEKEEEGEKELEDKEEGLDHESEVDLDSDVGGGDDSAESVDEDSEILEELKKTRKGKVKGPLFESNVNYRWKMCSTRSKHNYIPCIDIEVGGGKMQSYRHTERSCPRTPFMCMVPLPFEGYDSPVPWPESKLKVYEMYVMFNCLRSSLD